MTGVSLAIDSVAVLVLLIYHLWLARAVRTRPRTTSMGSIRYTREQWVARVMSEGLDLLAVQTLRNSTMAATFLASTAIVIALGALHLITSSDDTSIGALATVGAWPEAVSPFTAKVSLLAVILLTAFVHFTQTLRNFNHVCFMIATPAEHPPHLVAQVLTRGANHYTFGMRAYYLAIPISMWLFGSATFLVASALLVVMLARIDYV